MGVNSENIKCFFFVKKKICTLSKMAQRGVQTNLSQPTVHTFSFVHAEIQYTIYPHNVFCILCGMVETKRKKKKKKITKSKERKEKELVAYMQYVVEGKCCCI